MCFIFSRNILHISKLYIIFSTVYICLLRFWSMFSLKDVRHNNVLRLQNCKFACRARKVWSVGGAIPFIAEFHVLLFFFSFEIYPVSPVIHVWTAEHVSLQLEEDTPVTAHFSILVFSVNKVGYFSETVQSSSHARKTANLTVSRKDSYWPNSGLNRPFPSCHLPLFQNESSCKAIDLKMCFTYKSIFMQIKVIFIWINCTRTCFETKAKGPSEMAYCAPSITFFGFGRSHSFFTCWRC